MKMKWLVLGVLIQFNVFAETIHVTFIVPDQDRPTYFWHLVTEVAKSVAEDVKVDLTIRYSDVNRFGLKTALKDVLNAENKPDYLIFRPFKGNAVEMFNLVTAGSVPFITLEQAFSATEANQLGLPGQKHKLWLGMIHYDDVAGGALLTSALHKHHLKNNRKPVMQVTGIGGDFDQVSLARQANLDDNRFATQGVEVNQVFPMQWSPEVVTSRFPEVYKRYPQTDAFWCAGDGMAIAVADKFDEMGWPSNKTIVIGGFDWLPDALEKVHSGKITASVGGHFLMAAKALLKIVDYHHGKNIFPNQHKPEKYELVDQDNIAVYLPFMRQAPWNEIDFREFSTAKSPQHKPKDLTVANLLDSYLRHSKKVR